MKVWQQPRLNLGVWGEYGSWWGWGERQSLFHNITARLRWKLVPTQLCHFVNTHLLANKQKPSAQSVCEPDEASPLVPLSALSDCQFAYKIPVGILLPQAGSCKLEFLIINGWRQAHVGITLLSSESKDASYRHQILTLCSAVWESSLKYFNHSIYFNLLHLHQEKPFLTLISLSHLFLTFLQTLKSQALVEMRLTENTWNSSLENAVFVIFYYLTTPGRWTPS